MTVVVHYHAFLREKLGRESELFTFSENVIDTARMLAAFHAAHPEFARLSHALNIAVNDEIAGRNAPVPDGARVDLLPPYGGG